MNRKPSKLEVEKEDLLQAVVVADSFHRNFAPAVSCSALLPLVNQKLLDYCLEWLNMSSVNEVILFCCPSSANDVKQHLKDKSYLGMDIKVFVSEGCHSYGDVMRALDKYAIIRNTFILLTADVVGNIPFLPIINKFKVLQQTDKGLCMMLLLKEIGNRRKDLQNDAIIAYNSQNRLMHYQIEKSKYMDLAMEVLLEQDSVEIRNDLLNCGVAVCSVAVPPLFSDNFDFQTLNDLIRGLLMNEEILQSTIYCEVLSQGEYMAQVNNWPMYQIVSQDVIRRWCYPVVPDLSQRYSYRKNSIYLKDVTFSKNRKLGFDIVIGNKTTLNEHVSVNNSIIGSKCQIGEKVVIENSYIFNEVIIESGSVIKYSVIGNGCHIRMDCSLNKNCILGDGVVLEENTVISNTSLVSDKYPGKKNLAKFTKTAYYYKSTDENSDSEDEDVPSLVTDEKICLNAVIDDDGSQESSDSDSEGSVPPALDDVNVFYNEVFDSLTRGYEDGLECENLILEINSSRYAYNIAVNEVNFNLIKAIMNIQFDAELTSAAAILRSTKDKIKYFRPLITNYIRNENAQLDCLLAFEEVASGSVQMKKLSPKILEILYDKDIVTEEIILGWYSKLAEDEEQRNTLKTILEPFIKWLQEAEEDSEDDSD